VVKDAIQMEATQKNRLVTRVTSAYHHLVRKWDRQMAGLMWDWADKDLPHWVHQIPYVLFIPWPGDAS